MLIFGGVTLEKIVYYFHFEIRLYIIVCFHSYMSGNDIVVSARVLSLPINSNLLIRSVSVINSVLRKYASTAACTLLLKEIKLVINRTTVKQLTKSITIFPYYAMLWSHMCTTKEHCTYQLRCFKRGKGKTSRPMLCYKFTFYVVYTFSTREPMLL